MKITPEEFVKEWQLTNSTIQLSKKWNIKPTTLATRAKRYRHKGIPLRGHDERAVIYGRGPGGVPLKVENLIMIAKGTK